MYISNKCHNRISRIVQSQLINESEGAFTQEIIWELLGWHKNLWMIEQQALQN